MMLMFENADKFNKAQKASKKLFLELKTYDKQLLLVRRYSKLKNCKNGICILQYLMHILSLFQVLLMKGSSYLLI